MRRLVSNFFSQPAFFSPRRNVWKRIPRSHRGRVPHGVFIRVRVVLSAFGVPTPCRWATSCASSPRVNGFGHVNDFLSLPYITSPLRKFGQNSTPPVRRRGPGTTFAVGPLGRGAPVQCFVQAFLLLSPRAEPPFRNRARGLRNPVELVFGRKS